MKLDKGRRDDMVCSKHDFSKKLICSAFLFGGGDIYWEKRVG